jgi:hypothetical protein
MIVQRWHDRGATFIVLHHPNADFDVLADLAQFDLVLSKARKLGARWHFSVDFLKRRERDMVIQMEGPTTEHDWKYLRGIHDEMLHALCSRINEKAAAIATARTGNPRQQYGELYAHLQDSNRIVTDCFDAWRRLRLPEIILSLRRHSLLLDHHIAHLSDSAKEWLSTAEKVRSTRPRHPLKFFSCPRIDHVVPCR